jgi:hypothetical protein
MSTPRFRYCVYGVGIVSDGPLALPEYADGGLGEVEYRNATASLVPMATAAATVDAASDAWHRHASLPNGATYVRWEGVGEFLVSPDGRSITGRRADGSSPESFQVYMLGQALSFALMTQGFEPLHATAVVVDNHAVVFLGESGFGKSSLAACFLESGYRLLTDDLLVLHETDGRLLAYPGPPRIKLFPKVARRFLCDAGESGPMNGGTAKLILPIDQRRQSTTPVELRAIYSLAAPRDACRRQSVRTEALTPREGFIELVKATFNRRVVGPERLGRQFDLMTRIADRCSVRRLLYPRTIDRLKDVRDVVLSELASGARVVECASR